MADSSATAVPASTEDLDLHTAQAGDAPGKVQEGKDMEMPQAQENGAGDASTLAGDKEITSNGEKAVGDESKPVEEPMETDISPSPSKESSNTAEEQPDSEKDAAEVTGNTGNDVSTSDHYVASSGGDVANIPSSENDVATSESGAMETEENKEAESLPKDDVTTPEESQEPDSTAAGDNQESSDSSIANQTTTSPPSEEKKNSEVATESPKGSDDADSKDTSPPKDRTPTPVADDPPPKDGTPTPPADDSPPKDGTPTPPADDSPPKDGTPTLPADDSPPKDSTPTPPAEDSPSPAIAEKEATTSPNEKEKDSDSQINEKDSSSQDGDKSSSASPAAASSESNSQATKDKTSDITPHSEESATKERSENASEKSSDPKSDSTPVKKEVRPANDDDDVVIVDDKSSTKKPVAVKQEPVEGETKEPSNSKKGPHECIVCSKIGKCKYNIVRNGSVKHLCDDLCFRTFKQQPAKFLRTDSSKTANNMTNQSTSPAKKPPVDPVDEKGKFCLTCNILITDRTAMASDLINGEIKDFCSEKCRSTYASKGDNDDDEIEIVGTSNVTPAKGQRAVCCVCMKQGPIQHEMNVQNQVYKLCGNLCLSTFCKQRSLPCDLCEQCYKPCSKSTFRKQSIQFEGKMVKFCSTICLNVFKTTKQKIVTCSWCHAKKSNFDMVERIDGNNMCQVFCSLNCLSLYRVQMQATSQNRVSCDQCRKPNPAQYHLTMSDASVRNFCTYECVVQFQKQFMPPSNNTNLSTNEVHQNIAHQAKAPSVPLAQAKAPPVQPSRQSSRQKANQNRKSVSTDFPVISNVVSLAPQPPAGGARGGARGNKQQPIAPQPPANIMMNQLSQFNNTPVNNIPTTPQYQVVIEQPSPKPMRNKGVNCRPSYLTKATSCRPHTSKAETQTDEEEKKPQGLLPVPIPIYVPVPFKMYHHPVPYPVPIPIPIPVPVFIPTTRKSAKGIMKHIEELQHKIPEDPFEAELLQMAEAVATADKPPESSESEDEGGTEPSSPPPKSDNADMPVSDGFATTLGEDLVQAAFRLSGFDQPILDLEDTLQPACIDPEAPGTRVEYDDSQNTENVEPVRPARGRKRGRGRGRGRPAAKKRKVTEEEEVRADSPMEPPPPLPSDADFALKFTYGVNAWTHWVIQKNTQKEESGGSGPKTRYKTSLLACSAEELNKSMCLFVKEVRKPSGEEYAADSIFYLCLGIQQYLYENGRIDNIFTDWYFEQFTEALNDVLATYEPKLNSMGLMVCRLEEEHLWECKQLGAHSPHVLLLTLIYFNTKFFMLRTPEDHLRLSFSHVVKHWKKSPVGGAGGRSVYLKYYAPNQTATVDHSRKKKDDFIAYEQMENADNPLRCPVKLYEFYLSKCPESIRNRSDVFYLVPERSCVPDSPVWYSTQSLTLEPMTMLLNRVRTVREMQESFLMYPMANNVTS